MAQNPYSKSPIENLTDELNSSRYALPELPGRAVKEAPAMPEMQEGQPAAETPQETQPKQAKPAAGNLLPPPDIRPVFESAAREYGVPVNVLMALGHQESRYRANAVGTPTEWGRAKGMMQYLDSTAKGLGINPFDPVQSINAAAKQLKERLDKGYSMEDAVKEHFAGPNRKLWGEKTTAYGREVLEKATRIFGQPNAVPEGMTPLTPEQKKAHDEQIAKNFSPAMPRDQYEYGFTLLNPNATPEDVQRAMSAYDEAQAQQTQAGANRVQKQFEILKSPEATFQQKLDAKLAGPRNGIVPQLPGQLQTDAAAENAQRVQVNPGSNLSDSGRLLKVGTNNLALNFREVASKILPKSAIDAIDSVDAYLNGKPSEELLKGDSKEMLKGLTPEMKAAIRKDWWDDEKETFGNAWTDWRSYAGGVLQSAPEMVATMVPSMALARGAYIKKLASGASKEVAAKAAARTAMLSGAAGEGALGGAGASREVRDAIMELPQDVIDQSEAYRALIEGGKTADQARKALAEDQASRAFVTAGVATGMFGGMGDRAIAKIVGEGVKGGILKRIGAGVAKGIVGEGLLEELPQSALGKIAQNEAIQAANPNLSLGAGVMNEALGGLAIGSAQGGGIGGAAGALSGGRQDEPAPAATPGAAPAPVGTPSPNTATEAVKAGPLTGAVEQASGVNPDRVTVTTPTGTVTGFLESAGQDGSVRVLGDDGQVYQYGPNDNVQVAKIEPTGPLTSAVEQAAEATPVAQPATPAAPVAEEVAPAVEQAAADAEATADAGIPVSEENQALTEPAVTQPATAAPEQKRVEDMDEAEARARLKYLAGQFRNASDRSIQNKIAVERKKVEARIKALVAQKEAAPEKASESTHQVPETLAAQPDKADADGFLRRFIKNKDAADEIAADIGGRVVENDNGSFDIVAATPAADNGYAAAKARADAARERSSAAGKVLDSFPKGAMGLTTDEAKATPEWKKAKAEMDKALAEEREANSIISKNYAKESRADRDARRAEKLKESANANANDDGRGNDGRVGGADRADGAGADLPAGSERADATAGEQPGNTRDDAPFAGAGSADAAPAADAQPALSATQQKAIDRIRKGSAFFSTKDKADGWVAKNEVGDLVEIEQTGPVRFTVKEKAAASQPETAAAPEAAPAQAPAITSENGKTGVVVVPQAVVDAMDGQMRKQKARITRLKNEAEKAGSLEDKRAAQLKVAAAEAALRKMRTSRFDSEDAAIKAIETGDIAAFAPHADIYVDAAAVIEQMLGQNDELDAEMQAYEAKADKPSNPNPSESQAVNDFIEGRRDTPPSVEEVKEELAADINDFRAVLIKHIRDIIPVQQKFERGFGRGQWAGYVKKLIASNDVLRQFSKTPGAAGSTAWVKPALAKAVEAKDLVRIAEKLEAAAAKAEPVTPNVEFIKALTKAREELPDGFDIRVERDSISLMENGLHAVNGLSRNAAGAEEAVRLAKKRAGQKAEPDAPKGGNQAEIVAPNGWRGNLIKTRAYAKDLIDAGKMDRQKAEAAWSDAEALAALIDGTSEQAEPAAAQAETEEKLHSAEAELREPKTLDEFIGAIDAGYRAHFDFGGTDGQTNWIEKTEKGWVLKTKQDDSSATSTKGGVGPAGGWDKLSALKAAEREASYRFEQWKPEVEAAEQIEPVERPMPDRDDPLFEQKNTLRQLQNALDGPRSPNGKLWADDQKARATFERNVAELEGEIAEAEGNPAQAEPAQTATLIDALYAKLPEIKDNNGLKKAVAEFDGKEPDASRMKEAQEAIEAALVRRARDIIQEGKGERETYDALLEMYKSQPNLNIRTSTSIENQAYSTPAPLAYVAARMAGIDGQATVYEPTAGNGMLLITADPANATANELEDTRFTNLNALGFQAIQGDALEAIESGIVVPKSQDAVITNPPFGSVKDENGKATKVQVDGYRIGKIDHLIAADALRAMKDDGRATLILGADKVAGGISTDDLIFFNWLYGNYNVVSHFEVDGKMYSRQGASWPVRIITIDGRQKSQKVSPRKGTIQRVDTWEKVYEQYENVAAALADDGRAAVGTDGAVQRPGNDAADVPAAAGAETSRTGNGGQRPEGNAGNVDGGRTGTVRAGGKRKPEGTARPAAAQRLDDAPAGADRLESGTPESRPAASEAGRTAKPARSAGTDVGNEFQAKYVPHSSRKDEDVLIPVNMAQPLQDALNRLEDQVGDIDEFLVKELGYKSKDELHDALMGLQVDSVAMAIHQIKNGKGSIIADQTGIGKGRQAAAIIRWAKRAGHIPVFVTVKPQLFTDMYGDLADIGTNDVAPLIMNSDESISGPGGEKLFANKKSQHKAVLDDIAATGELPEGSNALFLTYSQINKENVQRKALTALAPKAVFILDESHNAGGESATGEYIRELLTGVQGVTYLSATYAKRPDNMPLYFKTDIGEAIADDGALMGAMASGGLSLQTVVSNNLVKAGQMFRRERSYDGVSISTKVDTDRTEEHEALSDAVTGALRAIVAADGAFHSGHVAAMQEAAEAAGEMVMDVAGNQATESVNHTEFSSVVHNFVRQLLLGLKADAAADEAIAQIKAGKKPLVAVENTMGSFLAEYASNAGLKPGDALGAFDYRNVLSRALDRTRYVVRKKANGEEVREEVPLSSLDGETRAKYDEAQEMIQSLDLDIPVSPIDWVRARLQNAGYSVAEITGRNLTVDYTDPKSPKLDQLSAQEQKDKVKTTRMFNDGRLDALILNVAGSTGISLHASERFKDQRQRHMVIAQAAQDINIFMQMLGRIHRTGQVELPGYTILNVDLPAEKRPTALLSKKMKSLNANTSSNTESATSIQAADMLNKYGDLIISNYLAENPELAEELGIEPDTDKEGNPSEDIARKATGRLALMPVEVQKAFYAEVEEQYNSLIEYLNKTNQNDLEPRTFDFDARETASQVIFQGQNPDSPFGDDAIYNEYSVKAQGKAMTPKEIKDEAKANLDGKTPQEHAKALADSLEADYQTFLAKQTTDTAIANAQAARRAAEDFIKQHMIATAWRVEINGDNYNAVVTNLRSTHKGTGNPFAMSKLQVTLAVNGALRNVSVPATQFAKIEINKIFSPDIDAMFAEKNSDERETVKIITGNLLAAYGELSGVRGTIINFTKSDGTTEQGILLPKLFKLEANVRGDFRMPTAAAALKFLRESNNKDIGRFGISNREGTLRVTPQGRYIRISVPKSKAKGGKFFLDKNLIEVTGDFISRGGTMDVTVEPEKAERALEVLMAKNALYALPSMAEEAKSIVGTPQVMRKEQPKFSVAADEGVPQTETPAFKVVRVGDSVDGRVVREHVPNMSSIGASLDDYTILKGIREVPMSAFDQAYIDSVKDGKLDARTQKLADEITASGELNPLIVALDSDGAYIIEGGHRFDALISSGAQSIPAIVVIDESNPPSSDKPQYSASPDQTETAAFKRWFGDSKVVDADGKPLVVYHGTRTGADINAFDPNALGTSTGDASAMEGFFFSNQPGEAAHYAREASWVSDKENYAAGAKGAIYPVFLRIENPKYVAYGETTKPEVIQQAKAEGHDGVIDARGDYVVFEPEQIKSAIGNNGDFDPANPDIRYSAKRRSAGMTPAQLKHEITKGMMGPVVRAMIENGLIVIHETTATLPKEAKGVRGVQGFVMADGKIHLVPKSISAGMARGVMLHEVFHALLKQSLGSKKYGELMGMLGKIYRQYGNSGGKANAFVSGFQRVLEGKKRKDKSGNSIIPVGMEVEEFGAYSIEEYMREPDSLPGLIRRWVEDLIGFVKAAAYKWLGKQYGELTPAQLATLAKFAVMDVASANRGMMFGPAAEWFSATSQTNTPAFRRWFGDSKVVDAEGKPLVMYHGTAEDFTEFKPGRRGGAIFLSPNKDFAASYANEKGFAKAGYPDVGEPAFDGSNVMPVYVKAVKPFDYSNSSHVAAVAKRVAKTDPGGPNEAGIANGSWAIIERDSVQEAIKSLGFDGYYVEEMGVKNLAVYGPSQIKSAIGNNGDFDPNNPDIRFSMRNSSDKPLTRRQFMSSWMQHIARKGTDVESLMREGFRPGGYPNLLPPYDGGEPDNIMQQKYHPKAGDIVVLVPREGWQDRGNGARTRDGWKPEPQHIIRVTEDKADMYEAYLGMFSPANPDIRYSVSPEQADDVLDAAEKALEKRKDDYIGEVVGDMSLFAKLVVHPRTVASIHKRFTPVYQTGISQMETRDETIAELGADMQAYHDLPQESKQRVNQVLELGRLTSAVFTPTELGDGVVNTGTKNVVVMDEKTGKPKMTKVPVEATLTAPGEVVRLSKEEIDAYRGLRRMFDSALDRMRNQTIEEMGFGGFAPMDGKRPLVIEDAGNGKIVLKGSVYSDEEKAELREADGDKKRIAEILSTNPIMPIIRKFEGAKWNPALMGYEFDARQRDALENEMGDYLKKSAATQILELIDDLTPPAKAERIKNVAAFIGEIEQAKRAGYVPFARYGDYVVTVKESIANPNYLDNGDGRLIVQGLPDSFAEDMLALGATEAPKSEGGGWMIPADKKRDVERLTEKTIYSAKVELGPLEKAKYRNAQLKDIPAVVEAIEKAKKEWVGDNPNRRFIAQKIREKQTDKPVALSDVDALAEVSNLDNATWDFVRDKLADAIKARGFRRHFFHSDNVPGYTADFERSMADYVIGMAGYLSRRQHMRQWDNAITAIKDQPRLFEYASKYRDYVNNPQEELALVRQIGFFSYIAGVIASAVTNLTQVAMLTIPTLSQIAPVPLVLKEVGRAYIDAIKMQTRSMDFFDPSKAPADIREALMDAWEEGSFVPLETLDLMMTARQRNVGARKGVKLFNNTTKMVSATFTFAERLNRLVTFIAAARLAEKAGVKKEAARVLKNDALARSEILGKNWNQKNVAKWAIDESQYRMGKANRPTVSRGVGAAILQFKSYMLQTFEAWYRMAALRGPEGKKAAAASILSVLAFSGLWGFPGGEDLRKALEKLYKELTGEDLDMQTELRAWIARTSGSNYLGTVATKGIPYGGIPFLGLNGLDMTRVGMGNIAPDSPAAAAGIPFDMLVGRPMRAFEKTAAGSPMLGVAELSPNFIKNWITAGVWSADGVRDKRGNRIVGPDEIDGGDVALRGIGWTPTFITDVRDYEYAQRREESAVSGLKADYTGRLARAMAKALRTEDVKESEKIDAEIAKIYAEIEEHNAKAPASRQIEIGNTALRNRIQREMGGVSVRWGKESKRAREQAEELRGVFGLSEDDE